MKTYGSADADVIFSVLKKRYVEFRSDGVYLSSEMNGLDASDAIFWKYACELDGPDSPNPLTTPALPFPFTGNQLAAFMLDGVGAVTPSAYGDWENGPDQGMLDSMGVLRREPGLAITEAYAAYRTAQDNVGSYPSELQRRAERLVKIHRYRNIKANKHKGVFDDGITPAESRTRRERAVASNLELSTQLNFAKNEYNE